jgi:AraC-like DNA-binding protein
MDLRIMHALALMETHSGCSLSARLVGHEIGLSASRFEHLLKAETGSTFRASLRAMRLHKARGLLLDLRLRVKEVSAHCGYAHTSNLTREFKREFGISPSAYRQQHIGLTNSMSGKENEVDVAGAPD